MKIMIQEDNYPKEKCNEDIGCQIEPCLLDVRAICTPLVFLLSEPNLEALKWHATHRLHSIQCVHHAGLHMGVLIGPTQAS
jgi:hypothetical protein